MANIKGGPSGRLFIYGSDKRDGDRYTPLIGIAGVPDLHIHDLRHTVGMWLREAETREETIANILWHTRYDGSLFSVVQIDELMEALNRITDEHSRVNRSLAMIRREQQGEKSHPKVPIKNGK